MEQNIQILDLLDRLEEAKKVLSKMEDIEELIKCNSQDLF